MKIIYAMVHKPTGKAYIGSTRHGAEFRICQHLNLLRSGKHKNKDMQEDYNKYGEDYSFHMLDTVPTNHFKEREYFWMSFFDTYNPEKGYNSKDMTASQLKITDFPKIDMKQYEPVPESTLKCLERVSDYLGISLETLLEMKK